MEPMSVDTAMKEQVTVGEAVVRVLEAYGVGAVYGVISIHNLPVADAIGRRGTIRFVPARGEAGAAAMADAHGRFSGLGVALTSTGAGAGNAAGALMEALNAGTPMLHITGQVEREYLDRDASFIHETRDQMSLLRGCSKASYRILHPEQAVAIVQRAIQDAMRQPAGPVSIEIPIDVQAKQIALPCALERLPAAVPALDMIAVDALAERLREAQRPMLWVGGGAIAARDAVRRLADLGVAVVSSTHGRGILPDSHPRSLRAFHNDAGVANLLAQSDLLIVAGSRLRSNETATYSLSLPANRVQIDIDPAACNRNYAMQSFVLGDCAQVLSRLADKLEQGKKPKVSIHDQELAIAANEAEKLMRKQLGPYATLSDAVRAALPEDGIFVRDITMSGSTWGSRLLGFERPLCNIHSLAGAIGLGAPHAIGCAMANPKQKVLALVGDGGLMLNIGEFATAVQENLDIVFLVMNDAGYGVMRGIQKKYFGDRQYYNELHAPDFVKLGEAMGMHAYKLDAVENFTSVLKTAVQHPGPVLVEVDMAAIGPLNFAGPPQKKLY
jgi:acetolactate synthase I/II/III large subunit